MSAPTRNAATATATFWPRGSEDEYGRQSYGEPVVVSVTYDVANKHKYTSNGIENTPSSVIWMEASGALPAKGDKIIKGDYSSELEPVNESDTIKETTISDCSFLGDIDDLMIIV